MEHEPKSLCILHAARVKHPLKHTVESEKHGGSRNGMKARKEQIQIEVEHAQRTQAPPTFTQPLHGTWATGQGYLEGVIWW